MYWGRELLAGSVGRTRGSVSGSGVQAPCWSWSLLLNVFGVRVMEVAWAPFLPLQFLCWPPLLHFAAGSYYQLTDGQDKTPSKKLTYARTALFWGSNMKCWQSDTI